MLTIKRHIGQPIQARGPAGMTAMIWVSNVNDDRLTVCVYDVHEYREIHGRFDEEFAIYEGFKLTVLHFTNVSMRWGINAEPYWRVVRSEVLLQEQAA